MLDTWRLRAHSGCICICILSCSQQCLPTLRVQSGAVPALRAAGPQLHFRPRQPSASSAVVHMQAGAQASVRDPGCTLVAGHLIHGSLSLHDAHVATSPPCACRVVRFPTIASGGSPAAVQTLRNALSAEDSALNAGAALLLRAVDRFHRQHGRYPGSEDGCASEN